MCNRGLSIPGLRPLTEQDWECFNNFENKNQNILDEACQDVDLEAVANGNVSIIIVLASILHVLLYCILKHVT